MLIWSEVISGAEPDPLQLGRVHIETRMESADDSIERNDSILTVIVQRP